MFTRQEHSMEKLTAVWLLPIVASEVAAASGGLLAPHLAAPEAFLVLILSYVLWACSVPLAMSVLVLLFLRLALHKLPERDMGVSAWLALGPIGTGALGLVVLGAAAPAIFAANGLAVRRRSRLWPRRDRRPDPMGLWRLVAEPRDPQDGALFARGPAVQSGLVGLHVPARGLRPRHVCARARHGARLFSFAGEGLAVCLAIFWVVVAGRTVQGAWSTTLFVAPCLAGRQSPGAV